MIRSFSVMLCLLATPPVASFVVLTQRPQHSNALHANSPPKKQQTTPAAKPKANKGGGGATQNAAPAKRTDSKNTSKGAGKGGGGFSVRLVYSEFDLEDDVYEEEIIKFKNDATMSDVQRSLEENYGFEREDMDRIEYYLNGEWKPLKHPSALKNQKSVPIRNAATFGIDDDDDEQEPNWKSDGYDGYSYDDFGGPPLSMQIRDIVAELYKNEYRIHSAATMQLESRSGEIMSTKDYVMKRALSDEVLQETLISKVGCLDHMVQAIHFPFLWAEAEKKSQETDEDRSDSD